ncbi:MAG: ABC transporter substrate-binding protein [Clostridia bacterium]|nr:ABC transporter substrate-binding protein [Clostridia bacterium]
MKLRLLSILAVLALLFSLVACNAGNNSGDETTTAAPNTDTPAKTVITNALDLTAEWNKVASENTLVQGCIVVRNDFLEAHPDAVEHFLAEYEASINYLSTNLDEAAQMIVDNGIFNSAPVAKKAIPKCNVCFLDGDGMKLGMQTYLGILKDINVNAIGGALPADDFYYTRATEVSDEKDGTDIRVYTLNGTTGFGMAKLMSDAKAGNSTEDYTFTVKTDASEVTAALINGDADIAALPTNAASNVYNKTQGGVKVLAVNTLGCLYLLTNQNTTVTSFDDLKGKTVYAPAQNPTFILKYLCEQNGLVVGTDVIIDSTSYAQPAALKDAVAAGIVDIAVLPEPMVTIAINTANAATK